MCYNTFLSEILLIKWCSFAWKIKPLNQFLDNTWYRAKTFEKLNLGMIFFFFAAPWHARLGHPSIDVMRHVFQICKIPTINKNISDFCSHCCLSKSPRLPSSPSLSVYSGPFELVFTYLWGPTPFLSSTGYKYYISFVDANTRFTWIYLLKN